MKKKTYLLKSNSLSDQDLWIASINILKEYIEKNVRKNHKSLKRVISM